jgi:aspartyl-tRNA(Asn)/glutamyl-tRNA(Gln) amidotransferase subunit C
MIVVLANDGGQKSCGTLATGRTLHKHKVYDCARFFQAFFNGFFAFTLDTNRMSLTRHDVENIALLARLQITESELPAYVDSLSKILNFVEQLNAAKIEDIEPMAHPLANQVQRLRADEPLEQDNHEKYQRNAARVEAGLYLVPKVIE